MMIAEVLPYIALLLAASIAGVLLSSKVLSEKLVATGLLPQNFLGLVPALQMTIRLFGAALVTAGLISLGIQTGWINREVIIKYGFSATAIVLGMIILLLSPKKL